MRYRKRKASKVKQDAVVVGQTGDKQFVAKPVESLFSPRRNLRGAWDRQTVERTHAKAAKMSARAHRLRLANERPPKPKRDKASRIASVSLTSKRGR